MDTTRGAARSVRLLGLAIVAGLALLAGCSGAADDDADLFGAPGPGTCADQRSFSCASNEQRFSNERDCRAFGECTKAGESCGSAVWCARRVDQCLALPTCDAGDEEVSTCPAGGSCYSATTCGTTITCKRKPAACTAVPTCDPGDREVEAIDTCKKANVSCYSKTTCGVTIWCIDLQ